MIIWYLIISKSFNTHTNLSYDVFQFISILKESSPAPHYVLKLLLALFILWILHSRNLSRNWKQLSICSQKYSGMKRKKRKQFEHEWEKCVIDLYENLIEKLLESIHLIIITLEE